MSRAVTWSVMAPDGTIKQSWGTEPPAGWFNDVRACLGLALLFEGYPPVYAVRPVCSNDVDRGFSVRDPVIRFWGIKPEPGSQVWFFPDASMIGFGRDTNEVQRLALAFRGKLKAEKVAGGPDQRDFS